MVDRVTSESDVFTRDFKNKLLCSSRRLKISTRLVTGWQFVGGREMSLNFWGNLGQSERVDRERSRVFVWIHDLRSLRTEIRASTANEWPMFAELLYNV